MISVVYKSCTKTMIADAYGISVPTLNNWIRIAIAKQQIKWDLPPRVKIPPVYVKILVDHLGDPENESLIAERKSVVN